eukprot:g68712.t1
MHMRGKDFPQTGKHLRELAGNSSTVDAVCFSPDSKVLASGSSDRTVLWDPHSGMQLKELKGLTRSVQSICFATDGMLASGSWDKRVRLWDLQTGEQLCELKGHTRCVSSVCFSLDGRLLASGSEDGTTASGICSHMSAVQSFWLEPGMSALWSLDLPALAEDSELRQSFWRLKLERKKAETPAFLFHVKEADEPVVGPACDRLEADLKDKHRLRVARVGRGQAGLTQMLEDTARSACFWCMQPSSFSRTTTACWLCGWHEDWGSLKLPFEDLRSADPALAQHEVIESHEQYYAGFVRKVAARIEVAVSSQENKRAEETSGDPLSELWQLPSSIWSVSASSDGGLLASASGDGLVLPVVGPTDRTPASTGQERRTLVGDRPVDSLCFFPDGKVLESGDSEGPITLWNIETGELLRQLTGHVGNLNSICVLPRSGYLVSGSFDRTIRFWPMQSKEAVEAEAEKMLRSVPVHRRLDKNKREPPPPRWAGFVSHVQKDAGDACYLLTTVLLMEHRLDWWYDKEAGRLDLLGMVDGIAQSSCFLLFATQNYRSRPFCVLELRVAQALRKPIVVVKEEDPRFNAVSQEELDSWLGSFPPGLADPQGVIPTSREYFKDFSQLVAKRLHYHLILKPHETVLTLQKRVAECEERLAEVDAENARLRAASSSSSSSSSSPSSASSPSPSLSPSPSPSPSQ